MELYERSFLNSLEPHDYTNADGELIAIALPARKGTIGATLDPTWITKTTNYPDDVNGTSAGETTDTKLDLDLEEWQEFNGDGSEGFGLKHAANYFRRVLGNNKSEAREKEPKNLKDRKGNSSGHKKQRDKNTIDELTQAAFLLYWESKRGRNGKQAYPLTFAMACKQALRNYWKQQRKILRDKEHSLIPGKDGARELKRYSGRETWLKSIDIVDYLPDIQEPHKERLETVLKFLATGSKAHDAAKFLGVTDVYVTRLLQALAKKLPRDTWEEFHYVKPTRSHAAYVPSGNGPTVRESLMSDTNYPQWIVTLAGRIGYYGNGGGI